MHYTSQLFDFIKLFVISRNGISPYFHLAEHTQIRHYYEIITYNINNSTLISHGDKIGQCIIRTYCRRCLIQRKHEVRSKKKCKAFPLFVWRDVKGRRYRDKYVRLSVYEIAREMEIETSKNYSSIRFI